MIFTLDANSVTDKQAPWQSLPEHGALVRGEGLHTDPTFPSPSGFPSLRSCLDSHRELIYAREKKKLTKPLPEFCSRFLEFSAGLPLTCIEDSAQDYNVQSTGRGQYCTVFDRTFFIYNNENHAGICSLRNPTKCQKK